MTLREYLLVCLIEECAEVSKAATKALRFGYLDLNPETMNSNAVDLELAMHDYEAVREMLQTHDILTRCLNRSWIDAKKAKMRQWMQYSRAQGCLDGTDQVD